MEFSLSQVFQAGQSSTILEWFLVYSLCMYIQWSELAHLHIILIVVLELI